MWLATRCIRMLGRRAQLAGEVRIWIRDEASHSQAITRRGLTGAGHGLAGFTHRLFRGPRRTAGAIPTSCHGIADCAYPACYPLIINSLLMILCSLRYWVVSLLSKCHSERPKRRSCALLGSPRYLVVSLLSTPHSERPKTPPTPCLKRNSVLKKEKRSSCLKCVRREGPTP